MIHLTVLGSSAAFPSKKYSTNCIAVKHGSVYLFECCKGAQKQMMKFNVSYAKVKAVFLSHLHADAFLGLPGLIQTLNLGGRTQELVIVGPVGSKKFFSALFSLPALGAAYPLKLVEARPEDIVLEEKDFVIKAFETRHGVK